MIAAKLVELIELHASRLTSDVARDLITSERTRAFRVVRLQDLEHRIFELLHHLGNWIGAPHSEKVQTEFTDWGRRRFDQGIPSDNGLVDASFPRVEGDYVLPLHLHSLQELNARVGQFFDEALYYLSCGYEERARQPDGVPNPSPAAPGHA
jgi:hypothetical protein